MESEAMLNSLFMDIGRFYHPKRFQKLLATVADYDQKDR